MTGPAARRAPSVAPDLHPGAAAPVPSDAGAVARDRPEPESSRFVPGRWLAPLCALVLPLHVALGSASAWALLWPAILVALGVLEARHLRRRLPRVSRSFDLRLTLAEPNEVALLVDNASATPLTLALRDDPPPTLAVSQDTLRLRLAPHERRRVAYTVVPDRRGRHPFGAVHVRAIGRFGLGECIAVMAAGAEARVYPNPRATRRYALAARAGLLTRVGVHAQRRPGGGGELEQLREYVPGDPYRDVDWKATARRGRPVVRMLGAERSQTVLVAIDAGRMMAPVLSELTKLDYAIQAALLVTHVALRAGDRVGVIVFADDVLRYVPPMRGRAHYRRILDTLFDLEAEVTYVDFGRLVDFIHRRIPRRALVLLLSDLLDESQAGPMGAEVGRLRRRHLPVCVTMTDPVARAFAVRTPSSEQEAYARAAAADLLAEREAVKLRLRKAGVGLVEASPGELALAAVNRYLDLKHRRAL